MSCVMLSMALAVFQVRAVSEDRFWDEQFGVPGTDFAGVASIIHDRGTTWFAGNFSTIGGIQATNVAKWDGINWSALGGGVNGAADVSMKRAECPFGGLRSGTVEHGSM